MSGLIEALVGSMPPDSISTGIEVDRLDFEAASNRWIVRCRERDPLTTDAVVLACPSYVAARLLREHDDILAAALERLEYASCATVSLVYRNSAFAAPLRGHGFFVPRIARLPILACNYMSEKYDGRAPDGHVTLRAFLGGAHLADVLDRQDDEIVALAQEALGDLLDVGETPVSWHIYRYPHSMPQLTVGDGDRVSDLDRLANRNNGLFFAGGTLGAVGLADCITTGESCAERASTYLRLPASAPGC